MLSLLSPVEGAFTGGGGRKTKPLTEYVTDYECGSNLKALSSRGSYEHFIFVKF